MPRPSPLPASDPVARRASPLVRAHGRPSVVTLAFGLALALVLVVGGPAGPAAAHGEDGVMTVTAAEQVASDRVRIEVGIVYTNDNEPAEEAVVTATLTSPDGQIVGPVTLPALSGALYGAEIDVPGPAAWQVAVTSTTPAAEAATTVDVAAQTATTPTTATGDGETDESAEPLTATSPEADETAASDDDASSDNGAVLVIAGLVGLAIIAGGATFVVLRRRAAA